MVEDHQQPRSLSVQQYRLPLAPENGNFSISDYEKYELDREQFFDSSNGAIAGRSGGTVARLWRKNITQFNDRLNDVYKGPSAGALSHGVWVYCGPDYSFYDDYLSDDLDSYICGQYLARTRKF